MNVLTSTKKGVESGESYSHAAVRELEEELGIQEDLEFVCKVPACDETDKEHSALYKTVLEEAPGS